MASPVDVSNSFHEGLGTADLVELMERQLQELDATEFELPTLAELPTLESILSEPDYNGEIDSASDSEERLSTVESEPKASFSEPETVSGHSRNSSHESGEVLSCTGSVGSSSQHRKPKTGASVVRHVALTGIASQLVSAQERSNSGLPTSMAVGSVICIGTSHGLVMVFEPSQALKWCLQSHVGEESYGSVSALALSEDGIRLLAGYAKGHLCLFDLSTGNLVQAIPDAHSAHTAVLHLKWTDMPNLAMLSDSGGSVFEVAVKRTMGLNSNMSRCIFTGSRGEVCTVEPLLMSRFNVAPLLHDVIVAMATITKVIVVSLRPFPKVLFSSALRGSPSSLPLLAWQFVVIQMPDHSRVVDPVLAFGRQNLLCFYQVTHGAGDSLQFVPLRQITTEYLLHNIAWLNGSTMALLDSSEQCHVLDVRSQQTIETIDMTALELVYASQHFKASATGGNVSKAMAVAGERACYHSMVSFGNQVIFLGTRTLQVVTVRSWQERLDQLAGGGQMAACLQLARHMLSGTAVAVVGLPHRRSKRRAALRAKISHLVEAMLDKWHSAPHGGEVVQQVVDVCLDAGVPDLVVGRVWDTLQGSPLHAGVLLESLVPHIISGELTSLPPSLSQELLHHYEQQQMWQPLEAVIIQLTVTSLDLHQTVTLCRRRRLYDALIHIYTRGLNDYLTPLHHLISELASALDDSSAAELPSSSVALGNKLLVFVSCCLAGRGYPAGDVAADQLQQVKYDVFKCLTTVHTKNADDTQKPFPFLRTLLRFNTREFLNVLSLAFQEAEFASELGLLQRRRLMDILVQVMENSEDFSEAEVCSLYLFIGRHLTSLPSTESGHLDKVLQQLCSTSPGLGMKEERESVVLQLLDCKLLQHDAVQQLALRAHMWRVCEKLYISEGRPEKVLTCYLNDPARLQQVLPYLHHAATTQTLQQVQQQLQQHFQDLVRLDAPGTAELLLDHTRLSSLVPDLLQTLSCPTDQYAVLSALYTHSLSTQRPTALSADLQLQLVVLTCQQHAEQLLDLLHSILASATCSVHSLLQTVRQFAGTEEAEAFLLLRSGQVQESVALYTAVLRNMLTELKTYQDPGEGITNTPPLLDRFSAKVVQVASIVEAACKPLTQETDRQELWFPLLDLLLADPPAASAAVVAGVSDVCGRLVSAMLTQVSPPVILTRVLRQPSACQADHVFTLMQGLAVRYGYERRVYVAVSGALRTEQIKSLSLKRRLQRRPVALLCNVCSLCDQRYTASCGQLCVFRCGHSYHERCMDVTTTRTCHICASYLPTRQEQVTLRAPASTSINETKQTLNEDLKTGELTAKQLEAVGRFNDLAERGCRVTLLAELAAQRQAPDAAYGSDVESSALHINWLSNKFPLRLAPPPLH